MAAAALAFDPMILFIALGVAAVIAFARAVLGWAMGSS
jgi:hypothetical protein